MTTLLVLLMIVGSIGLLVAIFAPRGDWDLVSFIGAVIFVLSYVSAGSIRLGYQRGVRDGQIKALRGEATVELRQNDRGEKVWTDR